MGGIDTGIGAKELAKAVGGRVCAWVGVSNLRVERRENEKVRLRRARPDICVSSFSCFLLGFSFCSFPLPFALPFPFPLSVSMRASASISTSSSPPCFLISHTSGSTHPSIVAPSLKCPAMCPSLLSQLSSQTPQNPHVYPLSFSSAFLFHRDCTGSNNFAL